MRRAARLLFIATALAGVAPLLAPTLHALNLSISRADMERALELSRWPHTDAERTRFHDRYLTLIGPQVSSLSLATAVVQVEVVTEFRRVELLAEEHLRVGDSFGRGGTDEVVEALRPWRGRVAIDAYLHLPSCGDIGCWIPATDITVAGVGIVRASTPGRTAFYTKSGVPLAASATVEALFNASAVGQTMREVSVSVDGRELARVAVDFSILE